MVSGLHSKRRVGSTRKGPGAGLRLSRPWSLVMMILYAAARVRGGARMGKSVTLTFLPCWVRLTSRAGQEGGSLLSSLSLAPAPVCRPISTLSTISPRGRDQSHRLPAFTLISFVTIAHTTRPGLWPAEKATRMFGRGQGGREGGGEGRGEEGGDGEEGGREEGGGIRVNKCFASFASRRESDRLAAAGRVKINGEVRVDRPLTPEDLTALRDGIVISTPVQRDRADRVLTAKTLPCEVQLLAPGGEGRNGDVGGTPGFGSNSNRNSNLNFFRHSRYGHNARSNQRACFQISLREGRNRQIRRMCEARGLRVLELHRASVMNIDLQGLRGEGWWAHLNPEEEAQGGSGGRDRARRMQK
ncbi:hypothetical protein NSK_006360 [Nannochloropsis salina CCMP1776]|uniref:RNA-binding S4 domain-containing protein n=1 Tax=Nannochloropsis salina CCMP1776 TaxID=1027361 RepID=A0A4D9CST6_9STRA|nr:hypothetical protein NSK_006360 [Nannochloropsis salina CCMP1776]|eukprot:TFJ82240.1 hypothetical protein NSK_006360 [Nannochloropsis salina CCMP1776]